MKLKLFMIFIIILLAMSCKNDKSNKIKKVVDKIDGLESSQLTTENASDEQSVEDFSVVVKDKINEKLPEYTFNIYGQKSEFAFGATKIIITKEKDNSFSQELSFDLTETPDSEKLGFIAEDMNFDGYKDFRIQMNVPAGPNISYLCWIFNPSTGQFEESSTLENIISPSFDQTNKLINSYERSSAVEYHEYVYQYINNEIIMIKHITTDYENNKKTIEVLENGKMVSYEGKMEE
ncbi:MAG: hypothetical protein A2086_09535 [Spirochaetes bacterium GWD1_27_9]|nr:MAG: hypothetical protein A2Z98_00375 [Spirochaetes bacterium GWB1_27_13]OHD27554.1 MAG: hypothetical protein A2Y34_13870 [Spirochaetes bacterium GWC1_27_15]OHD34542.1 MAG: hypothetical protein A2086_09535 [Spirochaetes bacterium GWD1_27_9]